MVRSASRLTLASLLVFGGIFSLVIARRRRAADGVTIV